jgi:putative DNA primase/helicase
MDTVLIIEGLQGIGKSTIAEILASPAWFLDEGLNFADKDSLLALQGRWIVELAEFESLRKAESEQAKLFLSRRTDRFRAPYGRYTEDYLRQCVFIGTGNRAQSLKDSAGNRQYWPVEAVQVDIAGLRADRDQLWAEADQAYLQGEHWWLDKSHEKKAAEHVDSRREEDLWVPKISECVRANGRRFIATQEIMENALRIDLSKRSTREAMRVPAIMHGVLEWKLGRENGKGRRGYRPPDSAT